MLARAATRVDSVLIQSDINGDTNDPSARPPNRFFIEMRLSMQWLVATNDMKDSGGKNPLDAQWLRTINICLSKGCGWL